MQDIADELGVSRILVSSVINGQAVKRGYSVKTVEKIKKSLKERGYVPSVYARELRNGIVKKAGILHCGNLFSHLVTAFNIIVADLVASNSPFELMVTPYKNLNQGLENLLSRGVSWLIWIHAGQYSKRDIKRHFPYLDRFERIIIYNYKFGDAKNDFRPMFRDKDVYFVGVDRFKGYLSLITMLKKSGHSDIVFPETFEVSNNPDSLQARLTRETKVSIYGCAKKEDAYKRNDLFAKELVKRILILRKKHPVTAACFHDDEIAAYAMVEFVKRGIRIPEDMSVTGFDGIPLSEAFIAPLTTLKIPVKKMTECTMNLLTSQDNKNNKKEYCFCPELVKRKSHGKAKKQL